MEIDPTTGESSKDNSDTQATPNMIQVDANEWSMLKAKMDVFEQMNFSHAQNVPTQPQRPSMQDELNGIDKQLDEFDKKIDEAIANGDPVSKLMRQRDQLNTQKIRTQIRHEEIDPMRQAGLGSMNQIADEVFRGKMPYLHLVQKEYEANLKQMPIEQQASLDARQLAYKLAVGTNLAKIVEAEREKMLREQAENMNIPAGQGGRNMNLEPGVPPVDQIMSREAIASIRSKGQTVDEFYRRRGYQGGWNEYFKKHENYYKRQGLV